MPNDEPDATPNARRTCAALNKAGNPCRSSPLRNSEPPRCFAHAETAKSKEFFGKGHPGAPGSGRPRLPTATEVLRQRIEQNVDRWLAPLEDARDNAVVVVATKDGADITSEPDHSVRLRAVDQAFKWVYATPKSNAELSVEQGVDGGVVVRLAFDPKPEEDESDDE